MVCDTLVVDDPTNKENKMTDVVKNELSRYFKDMLYVCTRHESA